MVLLSIMNDHLRHAVRKLAPKGRRRGALVGASVIVASVLASVSIFATAPSAAPEVRLEKAWPVSVIEVAPGALSPMFTTFGRVEATQVARIQSDVVARIATVNVREGQWVERHDVLVTLESGELELRVREREADLARERAVLARIRTEQRLTAESTAHYRSMYDIVATKLARHRDLMEKRMISKALLDEVVQQANAATIEYQRHQLAIADFPSRIEEQQARIQQAEALLAQASLDLADTVLRAPFSGPVLRVMAAPGNHTVLGQPLVDVADAGGLEVRAPVPAEHADAVRRHIESGGEISARVRRTPDNEGNSSRFVLTRLAASVRDGQSGLDAFFIASPAESMPEIGRVLSLGVTMPPEEGVVALPVQSIYENDRIYEVAGDRLRAITVRRIGDHETATGEYRVLVRSPDIVSGQRIVTTQLPRAISGLKVAPVG